MKPVKVGICGLGTVGGGTFNVLERNASEIARRAGRPIIVEQIATRRDNPSCDTHQVACTQDIFEVVNNPEIDIVVELIGGYDTAYELVMQAIRQGKHVVTANKALIAVYGNEIFKAAEEAGVIVAFEAAVAGGIPIIKSIREGLTANQINWVAGIINGTGNYILTNMRDHKRDFTEVLAEAQALGYAEADPTFDVEGIDAAHKLTILASIAFGIPLQFDKAYTEGIARLLPMDIEQADVLGYVIKHLGITKRTEQGLELRVHPTLIPKERLLANVHGVKNAVMVYGDAVGPTLYYGAGAGAEPTASAVVADIIDVAREMATDQNNRVPYLAFSEVAQAKDMPVLPMEAIETAYYLRLHAVDRPGVLARVATILSDQGISIEALIQKEATEGELVPIILMTHKTREASMNEAIRQLEALVDVAGDVVRIRVENLDEQ
ncbi:homoserine dehydrogenase [Allopseudospirillum japonicum]|uniref:Homoserine dehydrogenase n=1 Tax=Allopseudospirillum japonicum TaxID=64971 RepID=A0A1H6TP99_9GAMM|nr:homoserine dehydrogenase [Allopseudospirillum japonicum]SEI78090.1 homoserine dehydrogenase [Allopseudospirillum japonicum]